MLEGPTNDISAMIGAGLEGSIGGSYSAAGTGNYFINIGGSFGLGLDVSPVTGANIQYTRQQVLPGTISNIFKF